MRTIKTLLLLSLLPFCGLAQTSLNAMTFNIRYATPNDGINQWENRKDYVAQTITFYEADLLGLQEATKPQVDYLAEKLSDYDWIGVGRDDGKEKGEYSPIFFKTDRFRLIDWKTVWLSETPDKPSKSWDAALPRRATIATLTDKKSKKNFILINTHYDHIGVLARENSSKLIVELTKELQKKNLPIILMGDFNSTPETSILQVFTQSVYKNTQDASKQPHFGPLDTFNGFESKERAGTNIDHIFVSKEVEVLTHASLSNTWEGRFASDHYAILTKLKF